MVRRSLMCLGVHNCFPLFLSSVQLETSFHKDYFFKSWLLAWRSLVIMYRTFLTKYAPLSFPSPHVFLHSLPPVDYCYQYFQLCSPRSSSGAKTKALDQLEKHIAISCLAADDKKKSGSKESWDHFLALQYTFECNGASASLFSLTKTDVPLIHKCDASSFQIVSLDICVDDKATAAC